MAITRTVQSFLERGPLGLGSACIVILEEHGILFWFVNLQSVRVINCVLVRLWCRLGCRRSH